MKKIAAAVFFLVVIVISFSCAQKAKDDIGNHNYFTDNENFYQDEQNTETPDEDAVKERVWQVTFSFYGIINDAAASSKDLQYGDGKLVYKDLAGVETTVNGAVWALKKFTNNSSGNQIPLIQVFFANSTADGTSTYFVLQLEGSSIAKNETYFINNDKLYKTTATRLNDKITKICFDEEPNDGIVYILSKSVRTGEPLSVEGKADLKEMSPVECKDMTL